MKHAENHYALIQDYVPLYYLKYYLIWNEGIYFSSFGIRLGDTGHSVKSVASFRVTTLSVVFSPSQHSAILILYPNAGVN